MVHYNIDTNVRNNVLIWMFVISIFTGMIVLKLIDSFNSVVEISMPYIVESLINILPVPTVFAGIYYLFDNYLWKTKLINIFLGIPNLNGVWKGTYWSNFKCKDPSNCKCDFGYICNSKIKGFINNECIVPGSKKQCINYINEGVKGNVSFEIIQTFTKISISSNHKKSNSRNRTTSMLLDNIPNGEIILLYEHLNEIDIFEADHSMKNHSGFNELIYRKEKEQEILEGTYYNDFNRQTYGKIRYIKMKE